MYTWTKPLPPAATTESTNSFDSSSGSLALSHPHAETRPWHWLVRHHTRIFRCKTHTLQGVRKHISHLLESSFCIIDSKLCLYLQGGVNRGSTVPKRVKQGLFFPYNLSSSPTFAIIQPLRSISINQFMLKHI